MSDNTVAIESGTDISQGFVSVDNFKSDCLKISILYLSFDGIYKSDLVKLMSH